MSVMDTMRMATMMAAAGIPSGDSVGYRGERPKKRVCNIPKNNNPKCPHCRSRFVVDGVCRSCKRSAIQEHTV